jgi:hypothetical protein
LLERIENRNLYTWIIITNTDTTTCWLWIDQCSASCQVLISPYEVFRRMTEIHRRSYNRLSCITLYTPGLSVIILQLCYTGCLSYCFRLVIGPPVFPVCKDFSIISCDSSALDYSAPRSLWLFDAWLNSFSSSL